VAQVCVVCNRPFTWRKKWERCWDEVTTCSKRCNAERKKRTRDGAGSDLEEGAAPIATGVDEAKRAAKKEAKAERRAIRAGRADASIGQKQCSQCSRSVDLLVRCQARCLHATPDLRHVLPGASLSRLHFSGVMYSHPCPHLHAYPWAWQLFGSKEVSVRGPPGGSHFYERYVPTGLVSSPSD